MKNLTILALVFILTAGLMTGCGCSNSNADTIPTTTVAPTSAPTTMPSTTAPSTTPSTDMTMPSVDDLVPGPEDTIDPSNGANQSTGDTVSRGRQGF